MNAPAIARRPAQPAWGDIVAPAGFARIAVVAGLIAWLYFDQLLRMVRIWYSDVDWSHGFLIIPFSLYLIHTRRAQLAGIPKRPSWLGWPIIVAGVAAYAFSIFAKIGYSQPLSMLVVIAGVVVMLGGWRLLLSVLFPIGFLLLAIPPPDYLYKQFTQPMQQFAAMLAKVLLEMLPNIEIERSGFSLVAYDATTYAQRATFEVAGACSGMRSLLAFAALGLAMAYFSPRPLWHRVIIALIVLPVALFCNVVRVVVTGSFLIYDLPSLAAGAPHMVLGLGTFALGLALYSLAIYILDRLFVEDDSTKPPGTEAVA